MKKQRAASDKKAATYKRRNEKKSKQLGMSISSASNKLKKMILFSMLQETGRNVCYRCGEIIANIDNLTIDHKIAWLDSDDPTSLFFDLDNVSFSHHSCNSSASRFASEPTGLAPTNRTLAIDDDEALQIYIRAISGEPRKQIANDYGVSEYLVTDIKRVRSFINATMEYRKGMRDKHAT